MKLHLDSHGFVLLYHEQFDYGHDNVVRVISTETFSNSFGHTKIIQAHIANWKRPPIRICALLKSKDKFEPNNEVSAPNVLSDSTEEVIPITIDNRTEERITIYRNTAVRFSEIVTEAAINNISKLPNSLRMPIKYNEYDLNFLKKKPLTKIF